MARVTVRRVPPEPPRYPASGAEAAIDPEPTEVPEESRVARRRASSAPAHEVQMCDLELLGGAPSSEPVPAASPIAIAPPMPVPIAIGPVTSIAASPWRAPLLVTFGVVLLAAGAAIGHAHHRPSDRDAAIAPKPAETIAAPSSSIPVVSVASLPRAGDGTVVGLSGHRLWIDGKLAEDWRAVVACGEHAVQVGSAGTLRKVDVPCGDEIVVPP